MMVSPKKQSRLEMPVKKRCAARLRKPLEITDKQTNENKKEEEDISNVVGGVQQQQSRNRPHSVSRVEEEDKKLNILKEKKGRAQSLITSNRKQVLETVVTPTTSGVVDAFKKPLDPLPADVLLMAKKRLGVGLPDALIGRDREIQLLYDSLATVIRTNKPRSLYLSGPPGTGKTATVRHTLRQLKSNNVGFIDVYINCMNTATAASVHRVLFDALCPKTKRPSAKQLGQVVEQNIVAGKRSIILVLDEVDQLETKNYNVLYTTFGWPSLSGSRLSVIGIANSLDLTERLLPKLKLKTAQAPTLMQFKPYSKDDVVNILKQRLFEADSLLEPSAVELCARKVSAVTGDIRKALDICKLAIERMQHQKIKQTSPSENLAPTTPMAPRSSVGNADVLRTVKDVYGSRAHAAAPALPVQQKLMLVAVLAMNAKRTTFGVPELYTMYKRACAIAKIDPIEHSDVLNQCRLIESVGLISVTEGGGAGHRRSLTPLRAAGNNMGTPLRNHQIGLLVDVASAKASLNDATLVSSVLNELVRS